MPRGITFLAPVQQVNTPLTVEVANQRDTFNVVDMAGYCWPALLGFGLWVYGWFAQNRTWRMWGAVAGWTLLAWAALRLPNGAPIFIGTLAAFLVAHVLLPGIRQAWRL